MRGMGDACSSSLCWPLESGHLQPGPESCGGRSSSRWAPTGEAWPCVHTFVGGRAEGGLTGLCVSGGGHRMSAESGGIAWFYCTH